MGEGGEKGSLLSYRFEPGTLNTFIYCYTSSNMWYRTTQIARKEGRKCFI